MSEPMDLWEKSVCISGRFEGRTKLDMELLLRGRGGGTTRSVSKHTDVLFSSDPNTSKAQKAQTLGVTVVTPQDLDAFLGGPLWNYKARMERSATRYAGSEHLSTLAWGAPASAAALKMAEETIGFPLPAAFRSFYEQANGMSAHLYVPKKRGVKLPERKTALIPWDVSAHTDGPLWKDMAENSSGTVGVANLLPLETIFSSNWSSMCMDVSDPKGTLRVGKRKVKEPEFFDNLYMFDAFHGYYQAGIWADRKNKTLWVMMGEDYGATWHDSFPIQFETYMEELVHGRCLERTVQNLYTKGWGSLRLSV